MCSERIRALTATAAIPTHSVPLKLEWYIQFHDVFMVKDSIVLVNTSRYDSSSGDDLVSYKKDIVVFSK